MTEEQFFHDNVIDFDQFKASQELLKKMSMDQNNESQNEAFIFNA